MAANRTHVVIGDRDIPDLSDVIRCFDADTGRRLWAFDYPAPGELDYGLTPRATPLIADDRVILQGALGHVTAVELTSGRQLWQRDLAIELPPAEPSDWGACSSPLRVGELVIVNPGNERGSLAALRLSDGKTVWQTPGGPSGHGSLILATLGGRRQLVGHDRDSLGGWDPESGRRLWSLRPPIEGDFNVPTPVEIGGRLLVATENNGARLYGFDDPGRIIPEPRAESPALAPDMSTPVHTAGRVFCVWHDLLCLDDRSLEVLWTARHRDLQDFGACFASPTRVLAVGRGGSLLLYDAQAPAAKLISQLDVLPDDDTENYSHPALVGTRLYLRGARSLVCVELAP